MFSTFSSVVGNIKPNAPRAHAMRVAALLVVFTASTVALTWAQAEEAGTDWNQWTDAQKETFLETSEITSTKEIGVGTTRSQRANLDNGKLTHDAHVQTIKVWKIRADFADGSTELNFEDNYKFNVAAYRLDRLINLNMVPVSIERRVDGKPASVSWWVDDVQMMELERLEQNVRPPDPTEWNDQAYNTRLFQELVYNTDANQGNTLITNDWQVRLIDFSRAFRTRKTLMHPDVSLRRVDRRVYEGLRALNRETLLAAMDQLLTTDQVDAILARRDVIVTRLDEAIATQGEAAVVCDLPGH